MTHKEVGTALQAVPNCLGEASPIGKRYPTRFLHDRDSTSKEERSPASRASAFPSATWGTREPAVTFSAVPPHATGTRKGAFILSADGKREQWSVAGPHFAGWEVYHLKGSPVQPDRLYASQTSAWFGQVIQRSDDGADPGGQSAVTSATMDPSVPTSGTTARSIPGGASVAVIRILLPCHLRTLANVSGEVELKIMGEPTLGTVLDALEARYPVLRGTIRDHAKLQRRPFVRFYACSDDWSHQSADTPLPRRRRLWPRAVDDHGRHGGRMIRSCPTHRRNSWQHSGR